MRLISTSAHFSWPVEAGEHSKCYRIQGWIWLFPICPYLSVEYGRVNLEVLELRGMRSSLKGDE